MIVKLFFILLLSFCVGANFEGGSRYVFSYEGSENDYTITYSIFIDEYGIIFSCSQESEPTPWGFGDSWHISPVIIEYYFDYLFYTKINDTIYVSESDKSNRRYEIDVH